MLQMLTKSAIVIPSEQVALATAAPLCPTAPTTPDVGERSVENLKALADLAYKTRDLAFAEAIVRRIYAHYDQQAAEVE